MSRIGGGGGGGGVGVDNTFETINAAATAIAAAESRNPHATLQKRRWSSCWSLWGCFGSTRNRKRIVHAVLVPEPASARTDATPSAQNPIQSPSIVPPFVAPPSSPVSFINSEPPSATRSPTNGLSLSANSASMYSSPSGPASGFAVGPYAHETQLVTPPTFSTFTTEPSTAPFTPPPESIHMTTPSSPEVPFARLLDPYNENGIDVQRLPLSQHEFQSYFLQPGSPVSHLISPCSGISGSGTSSPLPDNDYFPGRLHFLDIRNSKFQKLKTRGWASGNMTPEAVTPDSELSNANEYPKHDETVIDHRVSFEITSEVIRCAEKKLNGIRSASNKDSTDDEAKQQQQQQQHRQRSPTLGSGKEFNFASIDGVNSEKVSDWWAKDKVIGDEGGGGDGDGDGSKNWSFFPVMQTDVR